MILIRANTERQIPVIRATLVSAPPSECLEIRLWTTVLNFGFGSRTTVFIFGLGSPTTALNFGFGSQTTALNFRLGSRTTLGLGLEVRLQFSTLSWVVRL